MSSSSSRRYAIILRLVGSALRMSRGYQRLVSLIAANRDTHGAGSQSKISLVPADRVTHAGGSKINMKNLLSRENVEKATNFLSGMHDFLCGLADIVECVGGQAPFAGFLRRWSNFVLLRLYQRRGSIEHQESSATPHNEALTSPPSQPHRVVCDVKEARAVALMWHKDGSPIDVPESMAPELAENIWQTFLELGVSEVLETAPVLAAKIGQQNITREKVKATWVRLEAKEKFMKLLEAQLEVLKAEISDCREQLNESLQSL